MQSSLKLEGPFPNLQTVTPPEFNSIVEGSSLDPLDERLLDKNQVGLKRFRDAGSGRRHARDLVARTQLIPEPRPREPPSKRKRHRLPSVSVHERRAKNVVAARKCREKKTRMEERLKDASRVLQLTNTELQSTVASLEAEKLFWKE